MKRTALLLGATLLASPLAFADDLCTLNLQKISDQFATATTLGDPLKQEVQDLRAKAEQAKTHGDTEGCINASNMALQRLQRPNTDGGSAGASQ